MKYANIALALDGILIFAMSFTGSILSNAFIRKYPSRSLDNLILSQICFLFGEIIIYGLYIFVHLSLKLGAGEFVGLAFFLLASTFLLFLFNLSKSVQNYRENNISKKTNSEIIRLAAIVYGLNLGAFSLVFAVPLLLKL